MALDRESYLLGQIDVFRKRARKLQEVLKHKEKNTMTEDVKQEINETISVAKRDIAETIEETKELSQQVVKQAQSDVQKSLDENKEQMQGVVEQAVGEMQQATEELKSLKSSLKEDLSENFKDLPDDIHKDIETLQNELTAQFEKIMSEKIETGNENLSKQMAEKMVIVKDSIADKIHMENVQSYRNVKTLLDEIKGDWMDHAVTEEKMKPLKGYVKCATWFSILNFILIVAYILYTFDFFG